MPMTKIYALDDKPIEFDVLVIPRAHRALRKTKDGLYHPEVSIHPQTVDAEKRPWGASYVWLEVRHHSAEDARESAIDLVRKFVAKFSGVRVLIDNNGDLLLIEGSRTIAESRVLDRMAEAVARSGKPPHIV